MTNLANILNLVAVGSGAVLSDCEQYRYLLFRDVDLSVSRPAVFLMLNPSTADTTVDDPTIRRCRGFSESLGYQGIVVANLYALRATNPAALWKHPDPIGCNNDAILAQLSALSPMVICAWGANGKLNRVEVVSTLLQQHGLTTYSLGRTSKGAPRHPLYVSRDQQLEAWHLGLFVSEKKKKL